MAPKDPKPTDPIIEPKEAKDDELPWDHPDQVPDEHPSPETIRKSTE